MPKIQYRDIRFRAGSLSRIEQVNDIIKEYTEQGFSLTLRQVYYQCVSRGWIPNSDREYDKLGSLINDARLAGLIDWDAIEDRTRNVRSVSHWNSPQDIIESAADSFHLGRWDGQPYRIEVWIEKDALVGVIDAVCRKWDVSWFSCRGYVSQSEMWAAGQRIIGREPLAKTVILHLGDHDPSGIDMTRDIQERLTMFAGQEITVNRLALSMAQIRKFNPPPNPAKVTDSRYESYVKEYGTESWELDALEPSVIVGLIDDAIPAFIRNDDVWDARAELEQKHIDTLHLAAKHWAEVVGDL